MRLRSAQRGPPPRLGFAAFDLQAYTCMHAKPATFRLTPASFRAVWKTEVTIQRADPRGQKGRARHAAAPSPLLREGGPAPTPATLHPRITRRPLSFETGPSRGGQYV